MMIVPRCEILDAPENGQVLIPIYPVGSDTATYQCSHDFELSGSEVVTCECSSEWLGEIPTCHGGEYYETTLNT